MTFRHDINALRALAVIIVVLFHFNEQWLPGGFIGVDIFFVLSGYLMTNIIFSGLETNFSLLQFIKSRARRILPPLMVLCAVLLTLGLLLLPPTTLMILAKHILSSLGFLSNIVYWSESGYFDTDAHGKFLLHTWSLSVEWQFYIAYPILLKLLSNFLNKQQLKIAIVLVFIVAFIFSAMESFNNPSKAFFLLGPRVWELLFGGLLFLYPLQLSKSIALAAQILGLSLIFLSSFFIHHGLAWPLPWSLPVILGTGLVIVANRQQSFFSQNIVIRTLGKHSYSIYLWHWPVVVSLYYLDLLNQPAFIFLGIMLSLVLGATSYNWVEKRSQFSYKTCIALLILLLAAFFVMQNQGYGERLTTPEQATAKGTTASPYRQQCHVNSRNRKTAESACSYPKGEVKWAVLGDSHGVEFAAALASLLPNTVSLKHLTHSNCAPSYLNASNPPCTKWTNEAVNYLLNNDNIDSVLVSYRYSLYLAGELNAANPALAPSKDILNSLHEMLTQLADNKKHIFVVLPVPEMVSNINAQITTEYLYRGIIPSQLISTTKKDYFLRNQIILKWFENTPLPSNVHFINPADFMCNELNCFAIQHGEALYFDNNHLSVNGASLILQNHTALLENIATGINRE